MQQLPLPLAYRAADGEADFLVSEANAEAVAWLDRWPDWPMPRLLLIGPEAAGKSHLARIFARGVAATVIDDADRAADEAVFHAWNAASFAAPLVLTARAPAWARLPDLASRLAATPSARIAAPDDTLLAGLLAKQFRDLGLRVSPDVARYVLARIERSFAGVAAAVAALDGAALAAGGPVTVPLARRVLDTQLDLPGTVIET